MALTDSRRFFRCLAARAIPAASAACLVLVGACAPAMRGDPAPPTAALLTGAWEAPDSTDASIRAQLATQSRSARGARPDSAGRARDPDEVRVGAALPQYEPGDWDDPDEAMAATAVGSHVPRRISFVTGDREVVVEGLHAEPLTLPYRGDDVLARAAGLDMRVRALWDGEILVVRRSFGRARIEDRFRASEDGLALGVTRTITHGRQDLTLRFGYERSP